MFGRVLASAAVLIAFAVPASMAKAEGTFCSLAHPALIPLDEPVSFKQTCLDPTTSVKLDAYDANGALVASQSSPAGDFLLGFVKEGTYRIVVRATFADGSTTQTPALVQAGVLIVGAKRKPLHLTAAQTHQPH